jgi:hypothetical protein
LPPTSRDAFRDEEALRTRNADLMRRFTLVQENVSFTQHFCRLQEGVCCVGLSLAANPPVASHENELNSACSHARSG